MEQDRSHRPEKSTPISVAGASFRTIEDLSRAGHPKATEFLFKWAELQALTATSNGQLPPDFQPVFAMPSEANRSPYRRIGRQARNRKWLQSLPMIFGRDGDWSPAAVKVTHTLRIQGYRLRVDRVGLVLEQIAALRSRYEWVVNGAIYDVREQRRHYRAVLAGREAGEDFDEVNLRIAVPEAAATLASGRVRFNNTIDISSTTAARKRTAMWETHRPDPELLMVAMQIESRMQLATRKSPGKTSLV